MPNPAPLSPGQVECRNCGARYIPDFSRDYYGGENGRGGLCESCMMRGILVKPDPVAVTDEKHLDEVCLPGKGHKSCRYLAMMPGSGMSCAKGSNFQSAIDERAAGMRAQGNNCSGPPDYKSSLQDSED